MLEIHSPYMAAAAALAADPKTFGVRTFQWHSDFIDTYRGVLEAKLPSLPSPLLGPITTSLWQLVRSIAKRCSATLVASAWQVGKLTAHGVPNVVHRPFGIERDIFRRDARSFETRRALLALAGRDTRADETQIVIGVGRFAIEKRWDLVIDAFLRVRKQRDAILVLFGDGPEKQRMRQAASGPFSGDVVFPGFTKDREGLARSLASADAFLHGCPFETFGLSIAEAMSCGLPPVVPNDGAAAEMHDPACGEQYVSEDPESCAQALERLLARMAQDGESLREAAARAAARLPSVHEQFEHQVALYKDLLARRADR